MVWKQVANSDAGDADHFGGNDLDKIMQAFSGTDVDDFDINCDLAFRDGKLTQRNTANTFGLLHTLPTLTASRTIIWPDLAQTSTPAFLEQAQTFTAAQKNDNYIDLKAIAEPSSPSSGYVRYYIDSTNGKFSAKHSNGEVVTFE